MDTVQSLYLNYYGKGTYLAQIRALQELFMKIWEAQATALELIKNLNKFTSDKSLDFRISDDGLFRFRNRIWVPDAVALMYSRPPMLLSYPFIPEVPRCTRT